MVALDEDGAIARQFGEAGGNIIHGDVDGLGDFADGQFVVLAHVEEERRLIGGEPFAGLFNRNFERGIFHGKRSVGGNGRSATRIVIIGGVDTGDGRIFPAERAGRIGGELQRARLGGKQVEGEESALKGFSCTDEVFDSLHGHQATNGATERAENARLFAGGHGGGVGHLGEEAAVTRAAVGGVKEGNVSGELKNAAVDQRAAREKGGVVGEVAGGEIVGAVEDEVVVGKKGEGVFGSEALGMGDDLSGGVERVECGGGGGNFALADVFFAEEDLPLQVVKGDGVMLGDAESADACGGEVKGGGRTETTDAEEEDAGLAEAELTGFTDLR